MSSAFFRFIVIVFTVHIVTVLGSSLRLAGGTRYKGRLEVYTQWQWGTVCDDGWDLNDARVACRELGFGDPKQTIISSFPGSYSLSILLDDVGCTGFESRLLSCSYTNRYNHNCNHDEDVAIECYPAGSDEEAPQFSGCPEDLIVETTLGMHYANVYWVQPTSSDNIGIVTRRQSHSPGDRFELVDGKPTVYTVRYWVQDYAENEAECYFNVTIIDNEKPQLQCPNRISNYYTTNYGSIIFASTDNGSPNATITWNPLVARDNSGIPPHITSYPNRPGDVYPMNRPMFPPYSTTITATDESGNSNECQLHFVVVDTESPNVSCPTHSNNFVARTSRSSWAVFTDIASRSARLYWSPANATDNSGTVVSVTSNYNPGNVFPASIIAHQITYTAIDRDNNVGNCSFFITVEDWESPSIECPSPIKVYSDDGSRFAFVTWNITLNDNIAVVHCMSNDSRVVPTNSTLNHTNITLAQKGFFSIGTNLVEYVVRDMYDNIGKCLLTIIVTDNENPSIICPSNFSNYYDHIFGFHRLVADHGLPYATVTWSAPEVYDNSQDSVTWETFPYKSGDTFPLREFPPYNVKFTASDLFGNNRSCYIYFTVIDIEKPIITCPTNITNYYDTYYGIIRAVIDPGSSTSTVTWNYPSVSDNSGGKVNVTSSHQSGDSFQPKFYPPYEVEYIAEDESGNKNSCKFYFLVTDNNPPEFQCPSSVRVDIQTGMNISLVRWLIVVSDIELISLIQANHSAVMPSRLEPYKRNVNFTASAIFPTGITIIEYRFEDSSNNVAFCRFNVEISEYDSYITSSSETVKEHTITSAVTTASSLSTVNSDEYITSLPSRMSTPLASLILTSSLISPSSLLPSKLLSSSSSSSSSSTSSSLPPLSSSLSSTLSSSISSSSSSPSSSSSSSSSLSPLLLSSSSPSSRSLLMSSSATARSTASSSYSTSFSYTSLSPSSLPSSSSSSSPPRNSPSSSSPLLTLSSSSLPTLSSLSSTLLLTSSSSSPSSISSSAFTKLPSSSSLSLLMSSLSSTAPRSSASSSYSFVSLSSSSLLSTRSSSSPPPNSPSSSSSPSRSLTSSSLSSIPPLPISPSSSSSSTSSSLSSAFTLLSSSSSSSSLLLTTLSTTPSSSSSSLSSYSSLSTDQHLTDVYHPTDPHLTVFTDGPPHDQYSTDISSQYTYHQQNGQTQIEKGSTDQRPAVEQTTTNQQHSPRQQPTHKQTTYSYFDRRWNKVTITSEPFRTTVDELESSLQTEQYGMPPTEPNEASISNKSNETVKDNFYHPTSFSMTSRLLAAGSKTKTKNNTGTGGITVMIICLCIFGGLSFFVNIFLVIKKKKVVKWAPVKPATNPHSSNASGLDFDNPAYKIYVLEEIDKEFDVSENKCENISEVKDSKL